MKITVRPAQPGDLAPILDIHQRAFGQEEEAELVAALLRDPTAAPAVSLLADGAKGPVGHILFTRTTVPGLTTSILCPLAVVPEAQGAGVGGQLIRAGLDHLRTARQDVVFVLGHPEYYPRFGFTPAGVQGFAAPYLIPPQHAGAWMACRLSEKTAAGPVVCSDTLMDAKYWVE
jgi:putative acetyltransferase